MFYSLRKQTYCLQVKIMYGSCQEQVRTVRPSKVLDNMNNGPVKSYKILTFMRVCCCSSYRNRLAEVEQIIPERMETRQRQGKGFAAIFRFIQRLPPPVLVSVTEVSCGPLQPLTSLLHSSWCPDPALPLVPARAESCKTNFCGLPLFSLLPPCPCGLASSLSQAQITYRWEAERNRERDTHKEKERERSKRKISVSWRLMADSALIQTAHPTPNPTGRVILSALTSSPFPGPWHPFHLGLSRQWVPLPLYSARVGRRSKASTLTLRSVGRNQTAALISWSCSFSQPWTLAFCLFRSLKAAEFTGTVSGCCTGRAWIPDILDIVRKSSAKAPVSCFMRLQMLEQHAVLACGATRRLSQMTNKQEVTFHMCMVEISHTNTTHLTLLTKIDY